MTIDYGKNVSRPAHVEWVRHDLKLRTYPKRCELHRSGPSHSSGWNPSQNSYQTLRRIAVYILRGCSSRTLITMTCDVSYLHWLVLHTRGCMITELVQVNSSHGLSFHAMNCCVGCGIHFEQANNVSSKCLLIRTITGKIASLRFPHMAHYTYMFDEAEYK